MRSGVNNIWRKKRRRGNQVTSEKHSTTQKLSRKDRKPSEKQKKRHMNRELLYI